jgi:hypothetical protein
LPLLAPVNMALRASTADFRPWNTLGAEPQVARRHQALDFSWSKKKARRRPSPDGPHCTEPLEAIR